MATKAIQKLRGGDAHAACVHVAIAPGVVFCQETRTVYVEPGLLRAYYKKDDIDCYTVFRAACEAAKEVIPAKAISAYCWVQPGLPVSGMNLANDTSQFAARLVVHLEWGSK